jgi:hypothetical protein
MIKIIKDPYCDQMKTKKLIEKFCDNEDLLFRDSGTYFSFSIIKLIPYTNTGLFFRFINDKYNHKYICDGYISEENIVRIRFQPNIDTEIINNILYYLENENINAEITYPCGD